MTCWDAFGVDAFDSLVKLSHVNFITGTVFLDTLYVVVLIFISLISLVYFLLLLSML